MKETQFYIVVALSAICLVLSLAAIALGQSAQRAQFDFQKRQSEIQIEMQRRQAEVNRGMMSDKIGSAILQDLASVALKNQKIKDLLAKNGYNVSAAPSPGATGTSSSPAIPFSNAASAISPRP